jgi:hypothetical protein
MKEKYKLEEVDSHKKNKFMIRMFNGSVKNLRGSYALNSQTNK